MEDNTQHKYEAVALSEEEAKARYSKDVDVRITDNEQKIISNGPSNGGSRTFLYIAACTGNLAAFTSGICLGWTSPVLPKLQTLDDNPLGKVISQDSAGWVGSLLPLGAILGPFIAGIAADKIGRKKTLLLGNIPFIFGFLMNIMATNVTILFLSRFICGISVGLTFTVLPMYVGEIAEDHIRGTLGTMLQLYCVLGLLFSYAIGPYLSVKIFNMACIVVPASFLISFFMFIPESPYYFLQIGKKKLAESALMKLRSTNSRNHVQKELDNMKCSVDEALANKCNFLDIFKSKGLTKAYVLSNGLLVFQQISGINIVLFFAQNIFQDAGVALAPEICTIIVGIVQVISSAAASVLIDSKGKRFLLMVSAVGMAISQATLAYFFHLKDDNHSDVSAISWIPILCLIAYIITYCLGFGPIPWAVMGEMFPANVKSIASTFTAATCWFFGFILTKYFAILTDIIGKSGSFGLFGFFCVVAFAFVYKFLPETSGKSLQEIQDILNGNSSTNNTEK